MRLTLLVFLLTLAAVSGGCTGSATQEVSLVLRFATQPTEGLAGQTMPAFEVRLMDTNLEITVPDDVSIVRLSLEVNPGGLALQGRTEARLSSGRATFDGVILPQAANGYVLRATLVSGGATDGLSTTFNIRPIFELVGFSLAAAASNVPLNTVLEFTFSSAVAVGSVSNTSIEITDLNTNIDTPARGRYIVIGNVVRFEPFIPVLADLSDAGLLAGATVYAISIQATAGGVRSIAGDPLVSSFSDAFATRSTSGLPVPGDLGDPLNHASLPLFLTDAEDIRNGFDPCARNLLPVADRDSPQVISSNPTEGATNVGVVAGDDAGTTYVALPILLLGFSEPIGPWILRGGKVIVRNTDTNETYDLQMAIIQDRFFSQLRIQVLDLDSPFAVDTVPAGNYAIELTGFSDLAGNLLVNSATCTADGTLTISFSTP